MSAQGRHLSFTSGSAFNKRVKSKPVKCVFGFHRAHKLMHRHALHHLIVTVLAMPAFAALAEPQTDLTTAWKDGRFHLDRAAVVSRSDIVLLKPNKRPEQAMPLGNGRLGLAVWAEGGLTLQLNRADTLPSRLSPGQVVLPGLAKLTDSPDYKGRLDLYHGEFKESGGGSTATVYVQPDSDVAVIEVHGANPNVQQTAQLLLMAATSCKCGHSTQHGCAVRDMARFNRKPALRARLRSLAAITADARETHVGIVSPLTVQA